MLFNSRKLHFKYCIENVDFHVLVFIGHRYAKISIIYTNLRLKNIRVIIAKSESIVFSS